MKDVLEKFLLSTTDEVLDRFFNFGGARSIVGKDFVFIPGTRDPEDRLLLVGHADTVFASPPSKIEWAGNMAKAGYGGTKRAPSGLPSRFDRKPEPAKETPKTETVVQQVAAIVKDAKDAGIQISPDKAAAETGQKCISFQGKFYTLEEWEQERIAGNLPGFDKDGKKQQEPSKGPSHPSTGNYSNWTSSGGSSSSSFNQNRNGRHGSRSGGLGADDRVGDALIWLLRRSGHSILITDGEESGGIGAREAGREIPHLLSQHQFAIEVDRNGDQEMVFYDVSTPEFEQYMLRMCGSHWAINRGTYTDIKDVCRAAGICGVNMAAGYYGQHTSDERFVYDFWLRTFRVIQKMTTMQHPRFELPKPKVVEEKPTTAAPKSLPPAVVSSGGKDTAATGTAPTKKEKKKKGSDSSPVASSGGSPTSSSAGTTGEQKDFIDQMLDDNWPNEGGMVSIDGDDQIAHHLRLRLRARMLATTSGVDIRRDDIQHISEAIVDVNEHMKVRTPEPVVAPV